MHMIPADEATQAHLNIPAPVRWRLSGKVYEGLDLENFDAHGERRLNTRWDRFIRQESLPQSAPTVIEPLRGQA